MGRHAHVMTKREIEYGDSHFNYAQELIYDWLRENGVEVFTDGDSFYDKEWQVNKDALRGIPETAYATLYESDEGDEISPNELREFVRDLLDAPTGEYAYISWF